MIKVEVLVGYRDTCIELLELRGIPYEGNGGYAVLQQHLGGRSVFFRYRGVRSMFAEQNVGLVYSLVNKQFSSYIQGFGKDDLIHEGIFGILRAIDTYQLGVAKFSTYAMWWIRHYLQRAIENRLRAVRIPTWQITKISRIERQAESDREPTDEEYLKAIRPKLSCVVPGPQAFEQRPVQYDMDHFQDLLRVREVVERVLDFRECLIIQRRFGFNGPSETLQEIGDAFGITRERVRQVEEKALEKLREEFE